MNYNPPGSTVYRISQARTLEWLPFSPLGHLPDPGSEPEPPMSPASAGGFFTTAPPGKPRQSPGHDVLRQIWIIILSGKKKGSGAPKRQHPQKIQRISSFSVIANL